MTIIAVAAVPPSSTTKPLKLISTSQTLPHNHFDYVLDMAFDYYGRRFATASGDRTVRVWDLNNDGLWMSCHVNDSSNDNNNDTTAAANNTTTNNTNSNNKKSSSITNEWQAHKGAIHRLSWAHPEFGQLLATAGSDHAVVIWEEREGGFKSLATPELVRGNSEGLFMDGAANTTTNNNNNNNNNINASRWVNKATLSDARRAVTTVEFAPRHLGLRLASGSADGCVRIYEALDTMNLNHWKLDGVIEEGGEEEGDAAGSAAGGGGGGNKESGSGGNNVVGGDPRTAMNINNNNSNNNNSSENNKGNNNNNNENMGVSSLSWCTGRFEPPTLAIGFSSGKVSIHRYDDTHRSWIEKLRLPGHDRGVLDVAWAPNVGRSYHWIATCGKDGVLMVHRVKRGRSSGGGGDQQQQQHSLVYEGTEILDRSQSWRCQWNVTGTVLASSGDGGVVKLWKADFQGRWKCVSEIVGDSNAAVMAAHGRNNQ